MTIRATGLFFLALSLTTAAQTPPKSRVVLTTDKSTYFLGENILVHYCFENTADAPVKVSFGGDYRGASRSLRFKFTVTDAKGTVMPDPDPSGYSMGGLGGTDEIKPGGQFCQSLPLMRYARIDAPGAYDVRVMHDLGWAAGTAPEGRIAVTLAMPNAAEAERVVADMIALPRDEGTVMGRLSKPYSDFSALSYGVYLTPLLRRAVAGDATSAGAIGIIPTPEATRALLTLLENADPAVARAAARAIGSRLPDPALNGALAPRNVFDNELKDPRRYLIAASWRPEFASDVRAAAAKFLARTGAEDVRLGAFMLEAVGTPEDAAILSAALTRAIQATLALPFENGIYPRPRGSVQELLRAADILVGRGYTPLTPGDTPGSTAFWLVAFGHGARPPQWQATIATALVHPIPYIRELAMDRLREDIPVALVSAIGGNLGSADPDVQIAACNLVGRAKIAQLRPQLTEAYRKAQELTLRDCGNALWALGGRYERVEILVSRLNEPAMAPTVLEHLLGLLDNDGWSGCCAVPTQQVPALMTRWRTLIAAHRADIEAGREISLDDPDVSPDLIPPGMILTRSGKPAWPAAR